ncbi:Fe(3+) ions import ATP-binding protein FbpC 2 [Vibrio stylophorae]|uniref:Fe(3+) ions import ATP-binding protein FbpC 2 n=1 Tax=Vibrio stylophorae TaxID=659351 RepID=A0ABN8DQX3_9VIBR|nr:ATP-binding cassette domain-containing protein [Vibrio stylophorae]CAH0533042.1 Fe(3+) ions import ATP-binding protein FbpC 2 [Vibrio stylophorae]
MPLELKSLTIFQAKAPHQVLLSPVSMTISPGEIVTVMGPSGCGKSTLLRSIAGQLGHDFHSQGEIYLNGNLLNLFPPHLRQVGLQWQHPLLFPHLNVWQNIAFALPTMVHGRAREQQARDILAQVTLDNLAEQSVLRISGGQAARVSLLRTLASEPKLLLLDEPFSALDINLRQAFRQFVFSQAIQANIPTLLVTHDAQDIPANSRCFQWHELGDSNA